MSRIHLLGIPLDPLTGRQAIDVLQSFLRSTTQHHVTTPNNEMLVEAQRNRMFAEVLRQSSLNLPDSTGLLLAAKWTGQHLPKRVTGVDTVTELCGELSSDSPVFLLGGREGVAEQAAAVLRANNPQLTIVGTFAGSPREEEAEAILRHINAVQPHLLLVAYGAPAQDLWIARHLRELPSVRVAMGIGGTLDFLAGAQTRAPVLLRRLGLEWFWRLICDPKRFPRIWRAVVVFPLLVARQKTAKR